MSDTVQREWRFYLDDMIRFAEKVIAYSAGFEQAGFVTNQRRKIMTLADHCGGLFEIYNVRQQKRPDLSI
jgi:hypothetical protein